MSYSSSMKYETWRDHKWLSVHGAMIAAQVMDRVTHGEGAPVTEEDWLRIREEARAVSDSESEVNVP